MNTTRKQRDAVRRVATAPAGPPRWLSAAAVKVGLARVREILQLHGDAENREKAIAIVDAVERGDDAKALQKLVDASR